MKRFLCAALPVVLSAFLLFGAEASIVDLGTFGGHQYFYDNGSYGSFLGARQAAQASPGFDLVSITSAEENQFLVTAIGSMPGGEGNLRCAWIGLFSTAGTWQWASDEPVSYTNWRPAGVGAPFSEPTGEDAGVMYINDVGIPLGLWADTWSSGEPFNAIREGPPVSGLDSQDEVQGYPGPSLTVGSENPFTQGVELRYRLPVAGHARLTVYDVQGRLVVTLVSAIQTPGWHTARWDGRNSRERRVLSGPYFVRLEVPGSEVARKVMLCR